jgi:hypothetical protein
MFTGLPRLIRVTPSISGGYEVELPISAPVIICGVSIVILGFGDAGCGGGGAVFTSAFNSFGFLPS